MSRLGRLLLLLLSLVPLWVHAWGAAGDQVIGALTEKQLSAKARARIQNLLALDLDTLASISTWADERKNPTTARWHFVDLQRTTILIVWRKSHAA